MIDILTKYILPFIFIIGFISLGVKAYLHFAYLKTVNNYPDDLSFFRFLSRPEYFDKQFIITLPVFFDKSETAITENRRLECSRLKRQINICLVLFYIGLISLIIGIRLQQNI